MPHILAIGNAPLDFVATAEDGYLSQHGYVKANANIIDKNKAKSIHKEIPSLEKHYGGGSANVVSCYASLGGNASFLGAIGHDLHGDEFLDSLHLHGVKTDHVARIQDEDTSQIFVVVSPDDKERTFLCYYGASKKIAPTHVESIDFSNLSHLYLEGFGLVADHGLDTYLAAIRKAKALNIPVIFNPSDANYIKLFYDQIQEIYSHADIFACNLAEAIALTGIEDGDEAIKNIASQKKLGAVTLSEKGCRAFRDGALIDCRPIEQNFEIVNTNGAGDFFTAGFLYGLTHGYTLLDAGELGNKCAGYIIQRESARPEDSDTMSRMFISPSQTHV